jgi:hypothetical protein
MDVMHALDSLWSMDFRSLYLMNQAYMVLLLKELVEEVKDYRPISLVHSFAKLFSKVLSTRLAVLMPALVRSNQSASIHGRTIHNNFMVVQMAAKLLHTRRRPCILFKIDIAMTFDTVNWAFLLELL